MDTDSHHLNSGFLQLISSWQNHVDSGWTPFPHCKKDLSLFFFLQRKRLNMTFQFLMLTLSHPKPLRCGGFNKSLVSQLSEIPRGAKLAFF